ncbi:hypothetical protein RJ641_014457 [Dillenia turbinata]|uniref:Uncharacterized protein n=1 Tax=Dillenia turbinata TaxID=194707 RepID=A0AAN8UX37_9MAGN
MEEEKAAAYYDELTRKGEGAARFKQGLGFSSSHSSDSNKPLASSSTLSSSSFLSTFVKASSPNSSSDLQKQSQLQSIQNKLKKKPESSSDSHYRVSESRSRRSSSRERDRERRERSGRSRSRERRERRRERSRSRERRSRSRERRERRRERSSSRERRSRSREKRERRRERSRSRERRHEREERRHERDRSRERRRDEKEKSKGGIDFSKLIEGYADMTAAERVKAKMKFQLSETAAKETTKSMGSGWERFEFNKDAPLDDEEVEVAEDDATLVKHIGRTFRFSAVESRREEDIQAAHDEAMFGAPKPSTIMSAFHSDNEPERGDCTKDGNESLTTSLISDKVFAKQQGSWRDRARKL